MFQANWAGGPHAGGPPGACVGRCAGGAPPEVKMQDIYKGIIPFVILRLIGLVVVVAWPDLALWLPALALE